MKKILSLVLALSLIISAAPMSFAEESGEAADVPGMYFNFNAAAFGKTADIPKADIQTIDTNNEFASIGTDPWYMDGHYALNDYRITSADPDVTNYPNSKPEALYWKLTSYTYLSEATSSGNPTGNAGSALVLRVKLNETDIFTPSITYEAGPTGSNYLFLLAPVSTYTSDYAHASPYVANRGALKGYFKTPNSNLIKIGEHNLYAPTSEKKPFKFDPVTIEAGEYYLFLVPNGRINGLPAAKLSSYEMNLYSLHFTPSTAKDLADAAFTAAEDPDYVPSNSASIAAYAVCGTETPESLTVPSVNYGETCELEAPLTKTAGDTTYNFLYWARGLGTSDNRKIVSDKNKFTYRPFEGVNYLIAVYEAEDASVDKVEFYNGNGERMTDVALDDAGNLPALPYMAGYGQATGWKLWQEDGNGQVFGAGEAAPAEGTRIFVAQYNDPAEDITISINGEEGTYKYGDTVTCQSDDAEFSYWEKTINGESQIVSIDKTYTFNAWESCTVEAVCNGTFDLGRAARKILLGTFTVGEQTAVMAEFVGFENAFEKGLAVDGKEITMQSEKNQFTITNDTNADVTVEGYAVLEEEGETVKYTDSSITVAGVVSAE